MIFFFSVLRRTYLIRRLYKILSQIGFDICLALQQLSLASPVSSLQPQPWASALCLSTADTAANPRLMSNPQAEQHQGRGRGIGRDSVGKASTARRSFFSLSTKSRRGCCGCLFCFVSFCFQGCPWVWLSPAFWVLSYSGNIRKRMP